MTPALDQIMAAALLALGGHDTAGAVSRQERMDAIGLAIAAKRKDAISHRAGSGIETIWTRCEESYAGIDDANRGAGGQMKWEKPTDLNGPVTISRRSASGDEVRSSLYVRLTSRYVDAGTAKLGEILLSIDDQAFSFEPTPIPELVLAKDSEEQVVWPDGTPATRHVRPEEMQAQASAGIGVSLPTQAPLAPGLPAGAASATPGTSLPPGVPLRVKDLVDEHLARAREATKKAERRITDQLVECQYRKEMRKVIFDSAKLGVGILKGPFPAHSRAMALTKVTPQADGTVLGPTGQPVFGARLHASLALEVVAKIVPSVARISPWNIYPDPACGEDISRGDYLFERDLFSPRQLRDLKGLPGYLDAQIEAVLKEGPGRRAAGTGADGADEKYRFEVWYYTGTLTRADMMQLNPDACQDRPEHEPSVHALVTMVNDSVIAATVQPLESGTINYHAIPWQRRDGHWAGVGIAEQVDAPQRMVVGAVRAMLTNAGLSAGGQIIIDRGCIAPVDGTWTLTPRKIWTKQGDASIDDVRKAFTVVDFPSKVDDLMKIIELGFRLAEESTNIPLITQGQSGKTTPDTYGAAQLQNNNANQLLRDIGYNFDDFITEPVIRLFYEWHLLDPDVPAEEKGDFKINAHGSVALVERAIQDQTIAQMSNLVLQGSKVFGVDPRRWFSEFMKSKRLNPKNFQFTPEEQEKMDRQPAPPDPRIQVAEIKAKTEQADQALDKYIAELDNQTAMQKARLDTDRDATYTQAEADRTRAQTERTIQELTLKRDLAVMEYANKMQITWEQAKAKLAETAMKLRTQKELAAADHGADLQRTHRTSPPVLTPPTEPDGRAQPGRAYQA